MCHNTRKDYPEYWTRTVKAYGLTVYATRQVAVTVGLHIL